MSVEVLFFPTHSTRRPRQKGAAATLPPAPGHETETAAIAARQAAERRIETDLYAIEIRPSADGAAHCVGELAVTGQVWLGDPCCGGESLRAELPAGRYAAVLWNASGLTARMGLNRLD